VMLARYMPLHNLPFALQHMYTSFHVYNYGAILTLNHCIRAHYLGFLFLILPYFWVPRLGCVGRKDRDLPGWGWRVKFQP
jgi:hypothetical protein